MTTETRQITINGLPVDIVRKPIKNLHLGVYPPNGRVRVAVPLAISDEAVRLAVISRLGWIKRQQAKFAAQERQSAREYVSGESHYFLGQRYRLNIIARPGPARVTLKNKSTMDFYVPEESDTARRERIFTAWYRKELKARIPALIDKWAAAMQLQPPDWGVKRMKTRWGTCNIKARRIWLNLELVKKPLHCLEYVIVHELAHLLERHHNDRFTALMDRFLPQWRLYREELNRAPLGWEKWEY